MIQPQILLWDRITGLPLKVAMVVAQDYGLVFKHSWKDHTISHKDGNEYMMSFAADGLHPRETFLDDPKTKTGLVDWSLQRCVLKNVWKHAIEPENALNLQEAKKRATQRLQPFERELLSQRRSTSLGNARGDINIGHGFFQEPWFRFWGVAGLSYISHFYFNIRLYSAARAFNMLHGTIATGATRVAGCWQKPWTQTCWKFWGMIRLITCQRYSAVIPLSEKHIHIYTYIYICTVHITGLVDIPFLQQMVLLEQLGHWRKGIKVRSEPKNLVESSQELSFSHQEFR